MIRTVRFYWVVFLVTFFLGMVLRFSFVRVVTFEKDLKNLNIAAGDFGIVWLGAKNDKGWIVLQYPDYSEPYVVRKVIGGELTQGAVEVPGEPLVSVLKQPGETVVSDGTPDASLGDSRSWGKSVTSDLILGRLVFHVPKGKSFLLHHWRRINY